MNPIAVFVSTSTAPELMLENTIRHRAYELYLHRRRADGHDVDGYRRKPSLYICTQHRIPMKCKLLYLLYR